MRDEILHPAAGWEWPWGNAVGVAWAASVLPQHEGRVTLSRISQQSGTKMPSYSDKSEAGWRWPHAELTSS